MKNMFMKAFPVLFISGWISGCGMFYGEVEEPNLCETSRIDIPGTSSGESSHSIETEFRIPSESHMLQDWGFKSGYNFSVTFEPKEGVSDFGFIDSAETRIHDENGSCELDAVAGFHRNNSLAPAAALLIESSGPVDPLPCLDSGKLTLLTTFAGDLPQSPWSMSVKVCLSGTSRIDANPK